jgi:hypothetical protein
MSTTQAIEALRAELAAIQGQLRASYEMEADLYESIDTRFADEHRALLEAHRV